MISYCKFWFLALRKAAVGEGVLTLDAQTALLAAVRAANG